MPICSWNQSYGMFMMHNGNEVIHYWMLYKYCSGNHALFQWNCEWLVNWKYWLNKPDYTYIISQGTRMALSRKYWHITIWEKLIVWRPHNVKLHPGAYLTICRPFAFRNYILLGHGVRYIENFPWYFESWCPIYFDIIMPWTSPLGRQCGFSFLEASRPVQKPP